MITITVISILAAMVMPMMAVSDKNYVAAGAGLMMSDLDFAQSQAINEPGDQVVVRFDFKAGRWWVAPESTPTVPFTRQYSNEPYDTTMGVGRALLAEGVTFSLTNVEPTGITYNAFGQLTQSDTPTIDVTRGEATITITVDVETGFSAASEVLW